MAKDSKKKAATVETDIRSEKVKALEAAIAQIEKDFGKGAIMKLGEATESMHVEAVPTGSLSLDIALGVGGIPKVSAASRREELLRCTVLNREERQLSPFTW